MIKELIIEHLIHKDNPRVFLRFENDSEAAEQQQNNGDIYSCEHTRAGENKKSV